MTTGGCLCGAVRFRIAGAFEHFFLCHCSRCRRDTGSAFAANLFSCVATITWEGDPACRRLFQLPGTRHARGFCARCGAALPSEQMDGALLVVPAGCLDTAPDIAPEAHLCHASRADWDHDLETLPKRDGLSG
ncbi:GFA family protein [Pseudooceanicola albus]|uniref:GFA family protein n=1 Tax=Pseudooceanicola albus TaxID=2692189 RepID=UPI0040571DF6